MLTACAARRWLARNAAGVKFIYSETESAAAACTSLVSCLPALQHVELCLPGSVESSDLGSLLEALAWCPSLGDLHLDLTCESDDGDEDVYWDSDTPHAFPVNGFAPAFAKLRSLTQLGLSFEAVPVALPDVVGALVSLTGLADLAITAMTSLQPAIMPAALGQLTSLRWLRLCGLSLSTCEAGCFDLPNLHGLELQLCDWACSSANGHHCSPEAHMHRVLRQPGSAAVCSACAPPTAATDSISRVWAMASMGRWWLSGVVQAASRHGLIEANAAAPGYNRE